ncbi:hypothetical protein D0Z00_004343 [Geotrichum galactomycetum]|uniref:Uncharacterized protein n=1 Tax=Geotrichum galactomycetum TaxID=27317 RepID=A0ACB6UYP8_9ASCO|nr:hypothetical protein D0Z00_004343 [Geotrichum candidum]
MSSSSREHNHGPQTREYTSAQAAAVNRVKKCKVSDYYAVLDIESSATETEIRKAYRKLALIMHPDKNGAPGADEAFKMVSKAFQVLSDPQKKRIFDQTGMDPESRGMPSGGGGGGGGGGPSMFTRAPGAAGMHEMPFGPDTTPYDLFNMFFGGAAGAQHGAFQTQFGPGIRVHFNGPGNPFQQARRQAAPQQEEVFSIIRLLPLLLLFIAPLLSSFFSGSGGNYMSANAHFEFSPQAPYTSQHHTPHHNVPYYVNPAEVEDYTPRKFNQLGKRAEVSYIQTLRTLCTREYQYKQQKILDSQGWFSVDQEAYDKAKSLKLQHCDKLNELGISYDMF